MPMPSGLGHLEYELAPPVGFTVQAEAPTTRAGKEATTSPPTEGRAQGRPVTPQRGSHSEQW